MYFIQEGIVDIIMGNGEVLFKDSTLWTDKILAYM